MEKSPKLKDDRYKNKICLVTGSTMGIGYAIAEKLGLEGGTIIVCSRKLENVKTAEADLKSKGIKCEPIACNFNSKEERKKLYQTINDKYGKLDVLVCNVAVNPYFGPAIDIGEKEFDKIFESNVKNTFFTIKEALPLMKNAKNSSILIISSQTAYTHFPNIGVYSMSKTALLSMTRVLADELAKYTIRVNCLAPGIINTKMSKALMETDMVKTNFLKRPGLPKEISGAAAFLCSEDASFITGETVCITGGMHGRL